MGTGDRRQGRLRLLTTLAAAALVAASVAAAGPPPGPPKAAAVLGPASFSDAFFREFPVFTGLDHPTTVRFAADGRAFVAEKSGVVKEFDSVTDASPTTVIDLSAEVDNYWDRGLLGLAIDPGFLTNGYLYLFYVYDAPLGRSAPVWNDACPSTPGPTADGCVVSSRLDRVHVNVDTNVADHRSNLIWDWCQQFPSHSGGGLAFGPDGQLYLSGGEGASFNANDYGQFGGTKGTPPVTPQNPCGDPFTAGNVVTAEGGSLRSQDLRTSGDPTGLDGSLIRINPATGAASPGNPLGASSDANSRRIVAYGFRNPFRLTFRPGTAELFLGDVGNLTWEEIERIVVPGSTRTPTTMPNFGWPCYEGVAKSSWQSLGNNMCTNLYAAGAAAVTAPVYQYSHWTNLPPSGPCFAPVGGAQSSSVTGLAFYTGAQPGTTAYPAKYKGALFFVDYSRNCLATLLPDASGQPDKTKMETIATGVGTPVDLLTGPGGDLYYVDLDGGRVVRVRYLVAPVAQATATPSEAMAPVTVTLDGSGSQDPDPTSTLTTWNWDLDGDGTFDKSGKVVQWNVATPGQYPVTLQVVNSNGLTDTTSLLVKADNDPPVPTIDTPSSLLTWKVGDTISFSGSATDAQDGRLPPSSLSWAVVMEHCPADCHEHVIETLNGVAGGSFDAPDHPWPSHLQLRLTATDAKGTRATTSVDLQPKTTTIKADSVPGGVPLFIAGANRASPSTTTVILGGTSTVSAPLTVTLSGRHYRFSTWNDSRTRVRDVVATGPIDLTATFVPDAPDTCAAATTTSPTGTWISERTSGNGDADWFRFTLTSSRRAIVTLGDLPVDGRLDLYKSCSTLVATSNGSGTRFEEISRVLSAGTYRVRVTAPGNAWSATPYVLRFRVPAHGSSVKSYHGTASGGRVHIVGEVLNNSTITRGRVTVTATLKNSAGKTIATLTGRTFAPRIGAGSVSPFAIDGVAPVYSSVVFTTTNSAALREPSLAVTSVATTANPNGTVTERITVRNTATRTARSVAVARTWYGRHGEILDWRAASGPATLAPGASRTITIVRPVLSNVMAARTQARSTY